MEPTLMGFSSESTLQDRLLSDIDALVTWNATAPSDIGITYGYAFDWGSSSKSAYNSHNASVPHRERLIAKALSDGWTHEMLNPDQYDGDVVLFVSNCRPGWRTAYLEALLPLLTLPPPYGHGLKVDSLGNCWHGRHLNGSLHYDHGALPPFHGPAGRTDIRNGMNKRQTVDRYKVFLSFENALTDGYLTEKYFHALQAKALSIYFGPQPLSRSAPARPWWPHDNALIDGWRFREPAKMAKLLARLAANLTARQELDMARKQFSAIHPGFVRVLGEDFARAGEDSWVCRLCNWYHLNWDFPH
jgi:hypothetical protein